MPLVAINRVSVLSATERDGAVQSMVTETRVTGLASLGIGDYTLLWAALSQVGIPTVPSPAIAAGLGTGFEALVLIGRDIKLVEGDRDAADITLHWDHILNHQELNNPIGLIKSSTQEGDSCIYGKMKCSISQKTTNFYPNPDPTVRIPITVAHTYPAIEAINGVMPNANAIQNRRIIQGGEIHTVRPMETYQIEGLVDLGDDPPPGVLLNPFASPLVAGPETLTSIWLGAVNSANWRGKQPQTWMVTEIGFTLIGPSPIPASRNAGRRRYRVSLEFQNDPDTWNTWAVFNDPNTGRPPQIPPSEQGVGPPDDGMGGTNGNDTIAARQITYLKQLDFNQPNGGLFQGVKGFY